MKHCKGFLIPQYKLTKQRQKNPFYLRVELDSLGSVNTTDEFLAVMVYEEKDSVCADCKQSNCKDGYEEETVIPKVY